MAPTKARFAERFLRQMLAEKEAKEKQEADELKIG